MAGYLEPAGPRVALRHLTWEDEAEFLRLTRASASLHHPWMELPATPEEFSAFMARLDKAGARALGDYPRDGRLTAAAGPADRCRGAG